MPGVAVVSQAVRTSHARNGHVNGRHQRDSVGAASGVTPAWHIPANEQRHQNGCAAVNNYQQTPIETHHTKQLSAYRRWMTKNKVGHSNLHRLPPFALKLNNLAHIVTSKPSNVRSTQKYRETPGAAVVLYMGIGMFLVGLVITFVGVGETGFQTLELQLIGPVLTGLGIIVCVIRVLICCCAPKCNYCDQLIQAEEPSRSKSPSASSGRSLRPNGRNRIASAKLKTSSSAKGSNFRNATPIPVNFPSMNVMPPEPSTSNRISLQTNLNSHSWDSQSLDSEFINMNGLSKSKTDADNSSSILSGDSSDDNNEFCEIELRQISTPTTPPLAVPTSAKSDKQNQSVPISETKLNDEERLHSARISNPSPIAAEVHKSIKETANNDKINSGDISRGLILDPQQYLTKATLAALNSTNK